MSGRPRNPTVWSNGSPNYPAGVDPWSGTTTVVVPVYNVFTPEAPVAAQSMNAILQDHSVAGGGALDWVGQMPALYWPTKYDFDWSAIAYVGQIKWYSVLGVWIATATTTGGNVPTLYLSADNGKSWSVSVLTGYSGTAGAGNEITGVVETPNGNLAVAEYKSSTGTARMSQFVAATATWSHTAYTFNWRPQHGLMFGGLPYFFSASAGIGGNVVFYRGDANATNFTAVMTYGTGTNVIQDIRAAASPTTIVAISGVASAGTPQMWTSTDGTTWTNAVSPFGLSRFISALAYGADDGIFMLAEGAKTVSGPEHQGITKIWTSGNGTTWTNVGELASEGVEDLVAVGSMWFATLKNRYAAYSLDKGVTWHYVFDFLLTSDATAVAFEVYTRPKVASNGGQFLVANGKSSRASIPAGLGASMVRMT